MYEKYFEDYFVKIGEELEAQASANAEAEAEMRMRALAEEIEAAEDIKAKVISEAD